MGNLFEIVEIAKEYFKGFVPLVENRYAIPVLRIRQSRGDSYEAGGVVENRACTRVECRVSSVEILLWILDIGYCASGTPWDCLSLFY